MQQYKKGLIKLILHVLLCVEHSRKMSSSVCAYVLFPTCLVCKDILQSIIRPVPQEKDLYT